MPPTMGTWMWWRRCGTSSVNAPSANGTRGAVFCHLHRRRRERAAAGTDPIMPPQRPLAIAVARGSIAGRSAGGLLSFCWATATAPPPLPTHATSSLTPPQSIVVIHVWNLTEGATNEGGAPAQAAGHAAEQAGAPDHAAGAKAQAARAVDKQGGLQTSTRARRGPWTSVRGPITQGPSLARACCPWQR